jgi:hypothetical protein
MAGNVSRVDLHPIIHATSQTLCTLKAKITEEVSLVDEEIEELVQDLKTTVNKLSREVQKSNTISNIDAGNMESLHKLVYDIQHTAAFSQVAGTHQVQLMGVFNRIENTVKKTHSKVERVDLDKMGST